MDPWHFFFIFVSALLLAGLSLLLPRRVETIRFPSPVEHALRYAYVFPNVMPEEMCCRIIEAAEALPWTADRHTQSTQDQPLQNMPDLHAATEGWIREHAFPLVQDKYGVPVAEVGFRESFVVKYDEAGQLKLDLHRDASVLTLIFALNSSLDYAGGGTYFSSLRRAIRLRQSGDLLLHCGKLQHGGWKLRRGSRYLLVCFLDCTQHSPFDHAEIATWNSAEPSDEEVMRRIYKSPGASL